MLCGLLCDGLGTLPPDALPDASGAAPHHGLWAPELNRVPPGEIVALVGYLLRIVGPGYWDQVRHVIRIHAPAAESSMISIADHLREEGLKQGRQEGRQEGQVVALCDTFRGVLRERFGEFGAALDMRIDELTTEALQRGILRAVRTTTVQEVFDDHESPR